MSTDHLHAVYCTGSIPGCKTCYDERPSCLSMNEEWIDFNQCLVPSVVLDADVLVTICRQID